MKKIEVRYTVQYVCQLDVESKDGDDLDDLYSDEISDIDIPDGGENFSYYVANSIELDSVKYV